MRPDGGASTSNTNGFSPISNGSTSSPLRKAPVSNSVNGRSSHSSPNGQPQANGSGKSPASISPTYFGHDREEVTRILIQSLHDLGYNEAASTLSRESGYELESPAVASFRSAVLDGRWADAEDILLGSYYPDRGGNGTDAGGGNTIDRGTDTDLGTLVLAEGADRNEMLFCLRQQKFLELLEQRDLATALMVLRQELTPLNHDIAQLHALSSLLMCPAENLRAQAGWDGSVLQSRQRLLGELSRSISPAVMIPDHRLAVLLDYVKQNQINQCLYHNTAESPSLYSDHQCDRSQFPLRTSLELSEHTDEVWYLEFSRDGTKLATTGRENIVIIYDVPTFSVIHRLTDHGGPVAYATWSPDDSKLISCSQDYKARLWDVETGRCILTIDHHNEPVTSAAWAPNGDSFVTGSLDRQSQLCHWSVAGESLYKWSGQYRVRDCSISPDGRRLIAISTEKKIYVYNFETRAEEYSMSIKLDLTCINISRDSRYMLLNTSECEMQLLDIETREVARQYVGQKQQGNDEYIIRNSFGGAAENFVVSGSEDSKIHIWHKENCTLVATLQGHGVGCVNAVSWNPKDPGMFASAGDDRKVRIWTRDPPTRTPVSGKSRMPPSNSSARTSALRSTFNRSPNF
ncbi:WD domain-containing protein [Blastomyces gilchristii SLH14081]|uniref:Protein FYV10 n=1 Tax=Blastomyces gilchristii (strain SLH14081) TaxID=559298 RepID=A0A179UD34_BLAGS|nr:WD domain-containing protein [Blastomyces gilchristii SLH14081]OAT05067.1 WD domain-containing protein [Blastomyces gilchristii SLH14081]